MSTKHAGRLIVHDRETHLESYSDSFGVGDTVEVIRGNGPREGDHMGTATITGIENGGPVLSVRIDGWPAYRLPEWPSDTEGAPPR